MTERSISECQRNSLHGSKKFHVSLSTDLLCQLSTFRVYCDYCISRCFQSRRIGIDPVQGTILVGTFGKLSSDYFLGVCLCLPSSYYFLCSLYFRSTLRGLTLPRWLNIHPSEQGAQIFLQGLLVSIVRLQNKSEAVQVPSIHSARCSPYSQLAIALDAALTVSQLQRQMQPVQLVSYSARCSLYSYLAIALDAACTVSQLSKAFRWRSHEECEIFME